MRLAGIPAATAFTPPLTRLLIVLVLAQLVITQSVYMFPRLLAVDFYHYWGVAVALRTRGDGLGLPYTNPREYAAAMADYAARPGDERLTAVSRILTQPGFTATPFFYMLFAGLPRDYTLALALFHALQVLLFLAAIIVIGLVHRYALFPVFCLAMLLVLGSGPFSSDLRVGNVGTFQLASLAAVIGAVHRLGPSRRPLALGAVILSALVLLALAKPNVALVGAVMAMHLCLTRGVRFFAMAAVPAALAGAAALILPCLYFRSWTVWHAWYQVVFGANPYGLAKAPGPGNYSTPKILAGWLHVPIGTVVPLLATAIALSLLAAAATSWRGEPRAHRGRIAHVLNRFLGDPDRAMAIAVTVTMALPPLFWYHYYVIALIPGLWLLSAPTPARSLPLLGLASLVLSSGLLNVLFIPLSWMDAVGASAALSWLPLWAGAIVCLYGVPTPDVGPGPPETRVMKRDERRIDGQRPAKGARGSKTAARS